MLPVQAPAMPTKVPTTLRVVERWLADLAVQATAGMTAVNTAKTYVRNIRPWMDYLTQIEPHTDPTPSMIQRYMAAMPHLAPATRNARLHALRALYRWREMHDLGTNIARSVRPIPEHRDRPRPALSPEQVSELIQLRSEGSTDGDPATLRDLAIIRLLFATGMRLDSLLRLRFEDIHPEQAIIQFQSKGSRSSTSIAHIPPRAWETLLAYRALLIRLSLTTGPLWIGFRPTVGSQLHPSSVRRMISHLMEKAGFAKRSLGRLLAPGSFSVHCLRRSALTHIADRHGLSAAQELAGHASVETTKRSYVSVQRYRLLENVSGDLDLPAGGTDA